MIGEIETTAAYWSLEPPSAGRLILLRTEAMADAAALLAVNVQYTLTLCESTGKANGGGYDTLVMVSARRTIDLLLGDQPNAETIAPEAA